MVLSVLHKGWAASGITPIKFAFVTAFSTEIFHSLPHPCVSHNSRHICNYSNTRDFRTECSSAETCLAAYCSPPTTFSLKHYKILSSGHQPSSNITDFFAHTQTEFLQAWHPAALPQWKLEAAPLSAFASHLRQFSKVHTKKFWKNSHQ